MYDLTQLLATVLCAQNGPLGKQAVPEGCCKWLFGCYEHGAC